MAWNIEHTDEFAAWWNALTEDQQTAVTAVVLVLAEKGPALGRPYVDALRESRIPNLKELRIQHGGAPYRVLFVFDPRQTAILLLGGKKDRKGWYADAIKKAEAVYDEYLRELREEGLI